MAALALAPPPSPGAGVGPGISGLAGGIIYEKRGMRWALASCCSVGRGAAAAAARGAPLSPHLHLPLC